jgi:hypothetical protein
MMQFVNVEADLGNLTTSLWQAIAIAWVLFKCIGQLSKQQRVLPHRA